MLFHFYSVVLSFVLNFLFSFWVGDCESIFVKVGLAIFCVVMEC